ncbi:MAG: hypothetical protein AAFV33_19735 [Chloroflexota bacterium]
MAVQVEQYGNEPIVIVTMTKQVTFEDINDMYSACESVRVASGSPVMWRVIEMATAQVEFPDVMDVIRHLNPDQPGSFADPQMRTIFGGLNPMASLLRDMLAKKANGDIDAPVLPGLGEALMFAQDEIYGFADTGV